MIPPKASAAFVAAMEDVLAVYTRPYDPARPLVCLDETSKQLTKETRAPIPMRPGQPARSDYEYERNGEPPRVCERLICPKLRRLFQVRSALHGIHPPFLAAADGQWRHIAARCCTS